MFNFEIPSKDILVEFLAFISTSFSFSGINSFLLRIINNIKKASKNSNKINAIDFFESTNRIPIIKRLVDCSTLSI